MNDRVDYTLADIQSTVYKTVFIVLQVKSMS